NPHRLIIGTAELRERRTLGADGDFTDEPAEHVALRELKINGSGSDVNIFINTFITTTELRITWNQTGDILYREISYMVIGDV
ncbi:MAG: hypothetical protein GTO02_01825, partial [Candidatus Dadabacteria bacterium]|nr:hypothetical protein [Candidatus Dadabacteria bacterium]NIQ13176.1 hypothetical protein [Candidatus Dadabacteria bacterium]